MCWPGGQHLLLAVNQITGIKRSQLKSMAMRNRVRGTSLHAIAAENASIVVDVVDLGIALGATHAVFGGVVRGLYVDAIRRTVGGAEEAGDALFQPVFIALQHVRPAEAGLYARAPKRAFSVRIIFYRRRLEHLHEGDAHALGDGSYVVQYRHAYLVYRMPRKDGPGGQAWTCGTGVDRQHGLPLPTLPRPG